MQTPRLMTHDLKEATGLRGARGVLLHGPPGTGKTLVCFIKTSKLSTFKQIKSNQIKSNNHTKQQSKLDSDISNMM
jgi:ATP-dependent 26S proteasome regulatory subunit